MSYWGWTDRVPPLPKPFRYIYLRTRLRLERSITELLDLADLIDLPVEILQLLGPYAKTGNGLILRVRAEPSPTELAKQAYRDVLRADPSDWDARFNLEKALRVLPDPDDEEPGGVPGRSERAATTMRNATLGLP